MPDNLPAGSEQNPRKIVLSPDQTARLIGEYAVDPKAVGRLSAEWKVGIHALYRTLRQQNVLRSSGQSRFKSADSTMLGLRFGLLVVQREVGRGKNRHRIYECLCDCGNTVNTNRQMLRNGHSKSCGCGRVNAARQRWTIHGHSRRVEYRVWLSMLHRCSDPGHKDYGGRGIQVCPRWRDSFENFLADMGPRPRGLTIERVDVDGNYEPGNCIWATTKQQNRNKRRTVRIDVAGKLIALLDYADSLGIKYSTAYARFKKGTLCPTLES